VGSTVVRDLAGKVFGRATVVKFHAIVKHKAHWLCRCSCGTEWSTSGQSLVRGHTQSCGCLHKERASDASRVHGKSRMVRSSYSSWRRMRVRCYNPNTSDYKNYGGRGIRVCPRWDDFTNFFTDMGERPFRGATIERLDNSKDYEPGNCVWRTRKAQNNNKRNNRLITAQGATRTLAQWAEVCGIKSATINMRLIRSKWTAEQALGFESPP